MVTFFFDELFRLHGSGIRSHCCIVDIAVEYAVAASVAVSSWGGRGHCCSTREDLMIALPQVCFDRQLLRSPGRRPRVTVNQRFSRPVGECRNRDPIGPPVVLSMLQSTAGLDSWPANHLLLFTRSSLLGRCARACLAWLAPFGCEAQSQDVAGTRATVRRALSFKGTRFYRWACANETNEPAPFSTHEIICAGLHKPGKRDTVTSKRQHGPHSRECRGRTAS